MKHVFCILCSEILREASRWSGRGGGRGARLSGFVNAEKIWAEKGRGQEHWAVRLQAEHIEESAWRGLAEWVGRESRRSALHAPSDLLEADLQKIEHQVIPYSGSQSRPSASTTIPTTSCFRLLDGSARVAVVRLTWGRRPEPQPWPFFDLCSDLANLFSYFEM